MPTVYLLLGSNINKEENIPAAIHLLAEEISIEQLSPLYETDPVGLPDQPIFHNAAVVGQTELSLDQIKLDLISRIETMLKRSRTGDKNGPRTIDIDILLYDELVAVYANDKQVPDPDINRFAHVAVPLAAIIPNRDHPETGEPFAAIAERLLQAASNEKGSPVRLVTAPSELYTGLLDRFN